MATTQTRLCAWADCNKPTHTERGHYCWDHIAEQVLNRTYHPPAEEVAESLFMQRAPIVAARVRGRMKAEERLSAAFIAMLFVGSWVTMYAATRLFCWAVVSLGHLFHLWGL